MDDAPGVGNAGAAWMELVLPFFCNRAAIEWRPWVHRDRGRRINPAHDPSMRT